MKKLSKWKPVPGDKPIRYDDSQTSRKELVQKTSSTNMVYYTGIQETIQELQYIYLAKDNVPSKEDVPVKDEDPDDTPNTSTLTIDVSNINNINYIFLAQMVTSK